MNRYKFLSIMLITAPIAACEVASELVSIDREYSGCLCDAKIAPQVRLVDETSWMSVALWTEADGVVLGELVFDGELTIFGQQVIDNGSEAYPIEDLYVDTQIMHGRVDSPTSPPLKLKGIFIRLTI